MIYGYAKVSLRGLDLEEQVDILKEAGCQEICKEWMTRSPHEHPAFDELILKLKKGDSVKVVSLQAVARKTREVLFMIEAVSSKGAALKSEQETWLDTSDKGQMEAFKGLLEFSTNSRETRAKFGHMAAQEKGRFGGRPPIPDERMTKALQMYDEGTHSMAEICKETGLKRSTIYDHLSRRRREEMMPPPPPPHPEGGHFPPPPPPPQGFGPGFPPPPPPPHFEGPHPPHCGMHHPHEEEFHRCDAHRHGGPHLPPPPPVDEEVDD